MNKSVRRAAPLKLTEKVKTPAGWMHVLIGTHRGSGRMSIELVPVETGTTAEPGAHKVAAPIALSVDFPTSEVLASDEFVAKAMDARTTKAVLQSGLFLATGKEMAGCEVWRLSGSALLELNSTIAPSMAASKVSFPSHLFGDRAYSTADKKALTEKFDKTGHTEHSIGGESIWVIREHCEKHRIAFVVCMVKAAGEVRGFRVCKAELSDVIMHADEASGYTWVTIYESPLAAKRRGRMGD